MLAEYLEHAQQFERMATQTRDAKLREQFLEQASSYRKLAEKRAAELGGYRAPKIPGAPDRSPQSG
jgi:hypothetical protein